MRAVDNPIRRALTQARPAWTRVTPDGFRAANQHLDALEGRVVRTQLLRKLFEDGELECDAPDGETATDGTACDECRDPRCRPMLRIWLASRPVSYILDLATTSALNLLAIEDQAHDKGEQLRDLEVRLTVVNRGPWGEVVFERR